MSHGELESVAEEDQQPVRSKRLIVWSLLLFVAFLIYEVTARPAFGIVILCSKFGWDTFLTGYWLWRVDSNVSRGRSCFWFYLAWASIKVFYVAFGLCIILTVAFAFGPPPQVPMAFPIEIVVALGTFAVGSLLCVLATLLGIWSATRSGLRIWLAYPRYIAPKIYKGKNWAELFSAIVVIFLWLCSMLLFFLVTGMVFGPRAQGVEVLIVISLFTIWWIAMGFLSLKLYFALKRRFVAEQPSECWQPDLLGELMVTQMPNWKRWRRLAAIPRSSN
jgi:hypothetical protein